MRAAGRCGAVRTQILILAGAALLIACLWIIGAHLIERAAPLPEPTPGQAEVIDLVLRAAPLGPAPSEVDRFIELSEELPQSDLRISLLSERRFVQLSRPKRDEVTDELMLLGDGLRALARATTLRIQAARRRGDFAEAESLIAALERYGEANSGPPEEIAMLGDLFGGALAGAAAAEREALDAARSGAEPPDPAGE